MVLEDAKSDMLSEFSDNEGRVGASYKASERDYQEPSDRAYHDELRRPIKTGRYRFHTLLRGPSG